MAKKKVKKQDPGIEDGKVYCSVCGCPHGIDAKCVQCRESWPSPE